MSSKTVVVDDRKFIVDFDNVGKPLRIKERKKYGEPPYDGWYNAPYWHAKHHLVGNPETIVARVIAAALAQTREG